MKGWSWSIRPYRFLYTTAILVWAIAMTGSWWVAIPLMLIQVDVKLK